MNEPRQGFLRTVLAGTFASDSTSLQGARGPPRRAISHVVLDNTFALPIDKFKE